VEEENEEEGENDDDGDDGDEVAEVVELLLVAADPNVAAAAPIVFLLGPGISATTHSSGHRSRYCW